jgi:hypothetical protein
MMNSQDQKALTDQVTGIFSVRITQQLITLKGLFNMSSAIAAIGEAVFSVMRAFNSMICISQRKAFPAEHAITLTGAFSTPIS